jgi:Na+-translocating ferredoxin:NAD+ oxidoreductase RNF subunit RnfB
MIYALITLAGLGLVASLILGIAGRVFHVEVDPRVTTIAELLPGANCGGCGFAGCGAYAESVVSGKAAPGMCPVNDSESEAEIAGVLGVKSVKREKRVAVLHCQGNYTHTVRRYEYFGVMTCKAAHRLSGGAKECRFGCLGYGDCQLACNFDSITIINGLTQVEKDLCTGCGACGRACPRDLIEMVPISKKVHVLCKSKDKGGQVTKYCAVGCIGCKRCEKICPVAAVTVTDFLATIEYAKCINCGKCAEVCPCGSIHDEIEARPRYEIAAHCPGCTLCKKKCPVDAISGEKKQPHVIDQEKCVQCGICFTVCRKNTINTIDPESVTTHMLDKADDKKGTE